MAICPTNNACNTYFSKGYMARKYQIFKDSVAGISIIATNEKIAPALEKYQFNTGLFFSKGGVILC